MTITLLLNSEGKKMGKTAKGAVWLDPNKTSPFEFFQYWRNVGDADVLKCIRMLTFLPLEQIDEMDNWEGSQLNEAKEILAYRADEAGPRRGGGREGPGRVPVRCSPAAATTEHMPTTELTERRSRRRQHRRADLLVKCGLAASKGEARRLVQQGGVTVNDAEGRRPSTTTFGCEQFTGDGVVIRKGKKVFHRAVLGVICLNDCKRDGGAYAPLFFAEAAPSDVKLATPRQNKKG